jgi:hypothetical protein
MSDVTGNNVAEFLGRGDDMNLVNLARGHAAIVTEMVKAYTRGRGFDTDGNANSALDAVITSATARLTSNPDSIITFSLDDYQVRKTVFEGFTIAENIILNSYRRKSS